MVNFLPKLTHNMHMPKHVHRRRVMRMWIPLALALLAANSAAGPAARDVSVAVLSWQREIEKCEDFSLDDPVAAMACEAAVGIAEKFGESDPRLAKSLDGLSSRSQNLDEVERMTLRSLEIRRRFLASDQVGIVATMGGMGTLRIRQNRLDEAITAYREAIEYGARVLGNEHLEVMALRLILGKQLKDNRKNSEAEENFLICLAGVGAERSNSSHKSTALRLAAACARLMGEICQDEGRTQESEEYFGQAFKYNPTIRP